MDLNETQARKISKLYKLGNFVSLERIPWGSVNDTYLLKTKKGKFIIQVILTELSIFKRRQLTLQFKVLSHLKRNEFPYEVPSPIAYSGRKYLANVDGFNLWVYKYIEGEFHLSFDIEQFREVSKALALYHQEVMKIDHEDDSFIGSMSGLGKKWKVLKKKGLPDNPDNLDIYLFNNIDFIESVIQQLKKTNLAKNMLLAHSDFHNENLIFRSGKLTGIIDFDNISFSPRVKDIILAINKSKHHSGYGINKRKRDTFLKVYEGILPLPKREKNLMKLVLIKDNFETIFWLYNHERMDRKRKYDNIVSIIKQTKNLVKEVFDKI
jgi:Ser/Thr protein kinase RdoA (MazF antagonist)